MTKSLMKTSSIAVGTRMDHLAVRQELQARKKLTTYHPELGGEFVKLFRFGILLIGNILTPIGVVLNLTKSSKTLQIIWYGVPQISRITLVYLTYIIKEDHIQGSKRGDLSLGNDISMALVVVES